MVEKKGKKVYDYFILLQPTSPLRTSKQIDDSLVQITTVQDTLN